MTLTIEDGSTLDKDARRKAAREKMHVFIGKSSVYLTTLGLGWVTPILKIVAGDDWRQQSKEIWQGLGVPVLVKKP